MTIRPR